MDFLIVSEFRHFLLTLGIAFLLFWRYRDWRLIPACFFLGFLIDIDHWFDYFVHYGFEINLSKFFDVCSYVKPLGKTYIPLHGWEFIAPFWLLGRWLGKKKKIRGLEWAVSLSYLGHLILDHVSFHHHPLSYSFIYRLWHNFSLVRFDKIPN